ncbi:hypothetical protein LSAT2_027233 [Lamellibrachia satsuma]|nr:hypothetical protein LSAT2_027233 [Lamellibrachia satsuma]
MDFCRGYVLLSVLLVVRAAPEADEVLVYGVCVRLCHSNFLHCVVASGCGRPFPLEVPKKCIKMREVCIENCSTVNRIF